MMHMQLILGVLAYKIDDKFPAQTYQIVINSNFYESFTKNLINLGIHKLIIHQILMLAYLLF
jgi:hypothetical protein